ncbi:hypothetical protein RJ641_006527 [Dillenia turbinata]|uniref:Uncharacterized protein n=1 Tax=Dillenia turbinata TaxID=194707 RepID=A0AAN8VDD4_9MAGN
MEEELKLEEEEEEEDERREAAIASAASLQPNFKPSGNGITQSQLSKFQELHRRRLEIKSKSKVHKKLKGSFVAFSEWRGKSHKNDPITTNSTPKFSSPENEVPSISMIHNKSIKESPAVQTRNEVIGVAPEKRQKLHWG